MTLAVVGSLTWVVASTYGSSTGVSSARGLPSDDPCAAVGEEPTEGLDGEVSSWGTGTYSNGCTWYVSLQGESEVLLTFSRSVPMSDADIALAEERGEDTEDTAGNAEELYSSSVGAATEVGYESDGVEVADSQERSLGFGDEDALVLTDIAYGTDGTYSQRATLVVREGDLVSQISFTLGTSTDTIDLDEAEEILGDMAAAAFE